MVKGSMIGGPQLLKLKDTILKILEPKKGSHFPDLIPNHLIF